MWTKEEEQFLLENQKLTNQELSSALSKTIDSIKSKKKRFGITSKTPIGYKSPNNRLTLIDLPFKKRVGRENKTFGLFLCRCGNMKEIRIDSVKSGKSKSCGNCAYKTSGVNLII